MSSDPASLPLETMAESLASIDDAGAERMFGDWQERGVSVARVQAAILLARDTALKSEAPAAETLVRFDRMQSKWVHLLDEYWRERIQTLETRVEEQGQESLLQEARTRWLEAGQVDLYNYHCEMPLVAQVKVITVHANRLHVGCTPELAQTIAAGDHQRTAFLQLAGTALKLRLAVEGTSGRSVHLLEDSVLDIEREQRRHIRVKCKQSVPMKLRHAKGPKWDAEIHDFSAFGIRVTSQEALPWPVGQELICLFAMGDKDIDVHGTVRWKVATDDLTRMGLEFPREHPFIHRLQKEVAERQQEILLELKQSGSPSCLHDVPREARLFLDRR